MKSLEVFKVFAPGILFSLLVASIVYVAGIASPEILGISHSVKAEELLQYVNNTRRSNNLADLSIDEKLSTAAFEKANDMLTKDYWAHFSPSGTSPWHFISKNGYVYRFAGENLAKGFTSSSSTFNAWMSSAAHRGNILSKSYTDTGFAVVEGKLKGKEVILVVQMFAAPKNNKLVKN